MVLFWQKLKQDKLALLCLSFIVITVFVGIFAPLFALHDPLDVQIQNKLQGISTTYWLGTDHLGRCVFSRLVFAIRSTLFISIVAIFLTASLGTFIGLIAGFFQRHCALLLMRLCDVLLSFPKEVMVLVIVGLLGPGIINIVIAIVVVKWAWYARMVYNMVLSYNQTGYVNYANVVGASFWHTLRFHLWPMIAADVMVFISVDIGSAILMISGLSFLGLGITAPTPEWGLMLSEAKSVMFTHPYLMLPAGIAIMLVVASFSFIGDFLRNSLDATYQANKDKQK